MPKVGDEVIIERDDWYPFSVGSFDGESTVPSIDALLRDVNGQECKRFLYYTRFEQISILD